MKKTLLFGCIFCLFLMPRQSFAENSDQKDISFMNSPYIKEMQKKARKKVLENMLKDKEKIMESLNKIHKYTDDEYQVLYNNYEVNPPFTEKDGQIELNPDYISKNTKYIEKDGKLVKNENYQPHPEHGKIDITKLIQVPVEQKKLGKKSYSINPDAFY